MQNGVTFHDEDALLFRLHESLRDSEKEVVFVVGAPLSAPTRGRQGVADVAAVVELIRSQFVARPAHIEKLDVALASSQNPYQTAFDFLAGRAGQDAANRIIKRAVAMSLKSPETGDWDNVVCRLSDADLAALDAKPDAWELGPGMEALGGLIAKHPDRFGRLVVTSNFDPLVEISVLRNGGTAWRTTLSADGSIFQSRAHGCQVVHIHGYWHGSDTLHTSGQLLRSRPTLKNDFLNLLQNKIVVVMAYGGWPDIFTGALASVVSNDNLFPEILWAIHSTEPVLNPYLQDTLRPGIERNRVAFYSGIDCHKFLPKLLAAWDGSEVDVTHVAPVPATDARRSELFRLAPLECDRPPSIDVWVGRESELRALETSRARVVVVCGFGGEGKSALASHYISTLSESDRRFARWDWRDCKEQSDRIRTQLTEAAVRFAGGSISAEDLSSADDRELVEVLVRQIEDAKAVLVFDNVDSYVDLENRTFIGLLDVLVQRMSATASTSRLLLTCRPDVQYAASSVITIPIGGLSEEEAIELFGKRGRGRPIPDEDVREAHRQAKGHAFWLDLLAVQVTKVPGTTLRKLLNDMRRGRGDVPDVLSSIWDKLPSREQTLLRFMAEAVRPETEKTIERFVSSHLNYNKFSRALRSLISLNLIVVKPESDAPDLYDLHPLVRQFVRTNFAPPERTSYIKVVLNQYEQLVGTIESLLGIHLPFSMLERWSQKAELEVSAGLYERAFETLNKVADSLMGAGHVQEYVRVGRLLLEAIDWETAAAEYSFFDGVVGSMVEAFGELGDAPSADRMLERYEKTIPQKTARYIKFCDIKAHSFWLRGEFDAAVEWASQGASLKRDSNVDTQFDCGHTLALARRDAGQAKEAIEYFLNGRSIEDFVATPDAITENGSVFGNVGRCLHLMGRPNEALVCYARSAKLLQKETHLNSRSNQAYARRWIGEVLADAGQLAVAEAFFVDAIRILGASAPTRVGELQAVLDDMQANGTPISNEWKAKRIVDDWIRSEPHVELRRVVRA